MFAFEHHQPETVRKRRPAKLLTLECKGISFRVAITWMSSPTRLGSRAVNLPWQWLWTAALLRERAHPRWNLLVKLLGLVLRLRRTNLLHYIEAVVGQEVLPCGESHKLESVATCLAALRYSEEDDLSHLDASSPEALVNFGRGAISKKLIITISCGCGGVATSSLWVRACMSFKHVGTMGRWVGVSLTPQT